jgi:site-specific DNA recombinase
MDIQVIKAKERETDKLRVAAYARVSTDHDEQAGSLDNQIRYYRDLISGNPGYELAGIYHDFGISGFKEKRPGFQEMMADARAGKIDRIITKSITRFARNTDTVLKATRELKEMGIGVYFELQNILTTTAEGELLLTLYAAFGQAESKSASDIAKMVYRRKYEAGIPVRHLDRSFGYTRNEFGAFEPDGNAKWVKKMFELAADGYSLAEIARYMNSQGVTTDAGARFTESTVIRILENVIYKGDFIMQKHFTDERRVEVKNRGQVQAWYIEDDHQRIVSDRLWNKAQEQIAKKREYLATGSVVGDLNEETYPYMNHIYCAKCGHRLVRRVYSNGNRVCWDCGGMKRFGKDFCSGVHVPDSVVRSWNIDDNIYIRQVRDALGKAEFTFLKESTWKRKNKKKPNPNKLPELTKENYPFLGKVYCKKCGCKLTRTMDGKGKVKWICSSYKRKNMARCSGVRIPDEILQRLGEPEANVYIGKEIIDGEERYGYTSQPDNAEG